jgi:hypothetical protein
MGNGTVVQRCSRAAVGRKSGRVASQVELKSGRVASQVELKSGRVASQVELKSGRVASQVELNPSPCRIALCAAASGSRLAPQRRRLKTTEGGPSLLQSATPYYQSGYTHGCSIRQKDVVTD